MIIIKIVNRINTILAKYNLEPVLVEDINVTDKLITDLTTPGTPLAQRVWGRHFPVYQGEYVWHYTSAEAARNILSEGQLRFYNLHKRFSDGEFVEFANDHGFRGYLDLPEGQDGPEPFVKLMSMNYYLSTSPSSQSEQDACSNWQIFAEDGRGVRLMLRTDKPHWRFKHVHYQPAGRSLDLLSELTTVMEAEFGRSMVVAEVSRMGCYYIRGSYSQEDEVRLLLPKQADGWPHNLEELIDDRYPVDNVRFKGAVKYVHVPLNKPTRFGFDYAFQLDLIGVQPGPNCDVNSLQTALGNSALSGIPLVPLFEKTTYDNYLHKQALLNAR